VPVDLGVPLGQRVPVVRIGPAIDAVDRISLRVGHFRRGEEEQLVPDDRATHVEVVDRRPVVVLAVGLIQAAGHRRRRQAIRVGDVVLAAHHRRRLVEELPAEMPFVGAALADHVEHAAVAAPVLRAVAAGVDLFLLDRAVRQGDAARRDVRIGGVEAVEVVRVLGGRRSAEAEQRLARRALRTTGADVRRRSQQRGRLASWSAVSTVRESTELTSIGGIALAVTLTPDSCFAFASPPAAASVLKETSAPTPTFSATLSRRCTTWPSRIRLTEYVPIGSWVAL